MRDTGRYKIGVTSLESFALDGGAMFGSVPKTLWEKKIPADAENRIPLTTRVLLIEGPEGKLLVDCGCGTDWSEKLRAIFKIAPLHNRGVKELFPDVNVVVLTHLHFDHGAGVTYRAADGTHLLSFPGARHIVQKSNWERANHPGVRERASYLEGTVTGLQSATLELVEDGFSLWPGISLHRSDGHTKGLQWVLLRDQKEIIAYPSDLIPTAYHVSTPFVMGYDLWPEKTMEEKELFLESASRENWLIIFEHDAETIGGRVKRGSDSRYLFVREDLSDLELIF